MRNRASLVLLGFTLASGLMQACMKAERLSTDTNTPQGLLLGSLSFAPPSTSDYVINVTLTGLTGNSVVLTNGADTLTLTENGSFSFPTRLASGASYAVAVSSQPINNPQTCVVTSAQGTAESDVAIAVTCTANDWQNYTVDAGLANSSLTAVGMDDAGNALVAYHDSVVGSTVKGRFYKTNRIDDIENLITSDYAYRTLQIAMNGAGQAFIIASLPESVDAPPSSVRWANGTPAGLDGETCASPRCYGLGIAAGIDKNGNVLLAHNTGGGSLFLDAMASTAQGFALNFGTSLGRFSCESMPSLAYSPSGKGALACKSDNVSNPLRVASFNSTVWTNVSPTPDVAPAQAARVATNDRGDIAVAYAAGANEATAPAYAAIKPAGSSSWITSDPLCTGPILDIAVDADGNALMACATSNTAKYTRFSASSSSWNSAKELSLANGYSLAPARQLVLAINPSGVGYLGIVQQVSIGGMVFVEAIDTRGRLDPPATINGRYSELVQLPKLGLAVNASGQGAASWGMRNGSTYDVHLSVVR